MLHLTAAPLRSATHRLQVLDLLGMPTLQEPSKA